MRARGSERWGWWPAGGAALALLLLAACSGPPPPRPPLEAPDLARERTCYAGTPLSGPRPGVEVPAPRLEDALAVTCRWVGLERFPELAFEPLAGERRLIAAVGSGSVLRGIARLGQGMRLGEVEDASALEQALLAGSLGRAVPLGGQSAALPAGVTAQFRLGRELPHSPAAPALREALTVFVGRSRDGQDLDVGLLLERGRAADDAPRTEMQLLRPFRGRAPGRSLELALVAPMPVESAAPRAVVILLSVRVAPRPGQVGWADHGQAFAECLGDLARERAVEEQLAAMPAVPPPSPRSARLPEDAEPEHGRAALLRAAIAERATLAADLALGAEERLVEAAAAHVQAALDAGGDESDRAWLLERAAAAVLGEELLRPEAPSPAARELLGRHVGGLAVSPATLLETLEVPSLPAWRERVVAENRLLLEQGWSDQRVHAWEWLAARGLAPAGYDPLAPAAARAAALTADRQAAPP